MARRSPVFWAANCRMPSLRSQLHNLILEIWWKSHMVVFFYLTSHFATNRRVLPKGATITVSIMEYSQYDAHMAGVAPRVAQEAMRHSDIKLTMQTNTDANQLDVASAIEKLPSFGRPNAAPTTGSLGQKLSQTPPLKSVLKLRKNPSKS
jgi:hypothetical protein